MCYNYNETKKQKRSFLVSHRNSTVFFLLFTGAEVTDHIPVDDNPVYITMKEVNLKRNTAYDTITISGKPQ